jgi:hypothetical protein
MKNKIKKILYKLNSSSVLKRMNLDLTYIFHTEKIYDKALFEQLILFCQQYTNITNKRVICTIIPPTNLLLKEKIKKLRFTNEEFVQRIRKLEKHADLGYHGHFYTANNPTYINAIHFNSFNKTEFLTQFNNDLNWFKQNNINHNNVYAGGWWFSNKTLIDELIKNKFEFDFTFSRSKYFYSEYCEKLMTKNGIKSGEVFNVENNEGQKITIIQNFIGMHTTPFYQDFIRNMKKLKFDLNFNPHVGVVNSHDYDLDMENTIKCIENIKKDINFISFHELKSKANSINIKLIQNM